MTVGPQKTIARRKKTSGSDSGLTDLQCPVCQRPVVKRSVDGIDYLKHIGRSCFSEAEGLEHIRGKQKLAELFRAAGFTFQLEGAIGTLATDILIDDPKQVAIEYQVSPISARIAKLRTARYACSEIPTVWLLSLQTWRKRRVRCIPLTPVEKTSLEMYYFHSSMDGFLSVQWVPDGIGYRAVSETISAQTLLERAPRLGEFPDEPDDFDVDDIEGVAIRRC